MPYKNPSDKTDWDLSHRPEKAKRARAAQDWADFQIETLKKLGVTHEPKEWRALKGELVGQFLKDKYGLGKDLGNVEGAPPRGHARTKRDAIAAGVSLVNARDSLDAADSTSDY